jgi:hypothetical protein
MKTIYKNSLDFIPKEKLLIKLKSDVGYSERQQLMK